MIQVSTEAAQTAERIRGLARQVSFVRQFVGRPEDTRTLDELAVALRCLDSVHRSCGEFLDAQVIGLRGAHDTAISVSDQRDETPPRVRPVA